MDILQKVNDVIVKSIASVLIFSFTCGCNANAVETIRTFGSPANPAPMMLTASGNTIRLALLLDTSSSMDGLIDQAKSQLWVIVNELGKARSNGQVPQLEIALYQYGNDGLSSKENWVQQILPFTSDLDTISKELFALTINGGSEYCGAVIGRSVKDLKWSELTKDLELIVIAGNEPFTQGPVNYKESCSAAAQKNIFINTIFCGDAQEGINTGWKNGGSCSGGSYMNIDQNKKTVYIETPYDDAIVKLNDSLNGTYIPFGSLGTIKQQTQTSEDANSSVYSNANTVNRTNSKVSTNYKNDSWDMVDATDYKNMDVSKIKEEDLPKEMRGMTLQQKKDYIAAKKAEREHIKKRIGELNVQRENYIATKQLKEDKSQRLDAVLIEAIHKQAAQRGFTFDK